MRCRFVVAWARRILRREHDGRCDSKFSSSDQQLQKPTDITQLLQDAAVGVLRRDGIEGDDLLGVADWRRIE
jgi:hypothetical protein